MVRGPGISGSDRNMEAFHLDQSGGSNGVLSQANLSWIRGAVGLRRCCYQGGYPAEGGEEWSGCLSGGCCSDRDPGWADIGLSSGTRTQARDYPQINTCAGQIGDPLQGERLRPGSSRARPQE